MKISRFIWTPQNIGHIAQHGMTPFEVEEACYRSPLVLKGPFGRYYVLGQTETGRHLFIVLAYQGKGSVYTITARDMTLSEKRRYEKR